jgi:hypothetical protein
VALPLLPILLLLLATFFASSASAQQLTYTRVLTNSTIGRAGHSALAISDTTIILIGGLSNTPGGGVTPADLATIVDPIEVAVPVSPGAPAFLSRPRSSLPGSGFNLPRHQAAVVAVPEDIAAAGLLPFSAYAFFGADTATGLDTNTIVGFNPVTRTWTSISASLVGTTTQPLARRGATAVFLRDCLQGGATPYCIVVVGGTNSATGTAIGTTFLLAFFPGRGTAVSNITYPAATGAPAGGIAFHSAVSSVDGTCMFVFGGTDGTAVSNDTFEFCPAGFGDNNMGFFASEAIAASDFRLVAASSNLTNVSDTSFVTDSTVSTCFFTASPSVTPTIPNLTNPWIRVDLGAPTRITQIQYVMPAYVSAGIVAGQHIGLRVFASNATDGRGVDTSDAVEIPNPYTDYIFNPMVLYVRDRFLVAQYVWFVIPSSTNRTLAICSASVFSPRRWMWRPLSSVVNLALRKSASQSTMDVGSFNYGNPLSAIDGDVATTSRTSSKVNSWFRVDLGRQFDIQYLTYFDGNAVAFPTANTGPCRSMNTEIAIGNNMDPWAAGTKRCFGPANANGYGLNSGNVPWRIECSGRARFVYVRKPAATMPTATTVPASDPTCVFPCNATTLFRGVSCNPSTEAGIVVVKEIGVWGSVLFNEPAPRMGAATARWGQYMVIFGGHDSAGLVRNDLRLFDTFDRTWVHPSSFLSVGSTPAGRSFATLTVLPSGSASTPLTAGAYPPSNSLLLHGGVGSADILNDAFVIAFPAATALSAPNAGVDNSLTTCSSGGTVCSFVCSPSFTRAQPGLYIAQRFDGSWSLDTPVCLPSSSSMPGAPLAPSVVPSAVAVGAVNFSWSANPNTGVAGALTTVRVAPVDTQWEARFDLMPTLDASWTFLRPNNTALNAFVAIDDTDGSLAFDGPANGMCNARLRNCGILYRPFPTGIPGLNVSGSWSLETYVYFDMFSSKSPNAGQEIGIGIYNPTKPLIDCTGDCMGGLEFVAGMQRISATANGAGYASHNLPTGAAFRWNQVPSTLYTDNSVGNSPWSWVRIDRDAANHRWRIGTKSYAPAPWGWNTWLTDAQLFRSTNGSSVSSTMVFQPENSYIAIYGLSTSTSTRTFGKVKYIRWMPLNGRSEPGPVAFIPTSASAPATGTVLSGLLPGSSKRYTVSSGGPFGYSTPSSVFGPVTAPTTTAGGGVSGWSSSSLINIAQGKPTVSISINTIPTARPSSLAVDGVVSLDTTADAATGAHTSPSFWKIDLGIVSAVKEIAIYGSSTDANANLFTSFHVAVLPRTPGLGVLGAAEVRNGQYCESSQLPDRIPSTSVYNNFNYAARFNCSFPQGLKGRYVAIMGMLQTALMFREVEVWTSNRCHSSWVPNNAQIDPGSNCAAGAPWGAVCAATCNPGFEPISGSLTTTCNGETWNDPPLTCSRVCPPLPAPSNARDCRQQLLTENFSNSSTVSSRFYTLNEGDSSLGYSVFARDGMLQIRSCVGCTDGIAVVSNNNKAGNWSGGFTLSARVMSDDRAGLVIKAVDRVTYFRIVLDFKSGLHYVERAFSSRAANQVGAASMRILTGTRKLLPDIWHTLKVVGFADGQADVFINNVFLMSFVDQNATFGSLGVYAVSTGFFDDFTYSIDCGSGCNVSSNNETCTFQCDPGFRPVNASNGVRTCMNGNWVPAATAANLSCVLNPPTLSPPALLTVPENSPAGTNVGSPINAISANPAYPVQFQISALFRRSAFGNPSTFSPGLVPSQTLFTINATSGQVSVLNGSAGALDFESITSYTLTVRAFVPGFPGAEAMSNVTVAVLNVLETPTILNITVSLVENTAAAAASAGSPYLVWNPLPPNTLLGSVLLTNPDNITVLFRPDSDGSGGALLLNPVTGAVSVAPVLSDGFSPAAFNFETTPGRVITMAVSVLRANDASVVGSILFVVSLLDANDPPLVVPGQRLVLPNFSFTNATQFPLAVGTVRAFDEDTNALWNNGTITYSILGGSAAASACGQKDAWPTTNALPSGLPLVAIHPRTGALTLTSGPSNSVWQRRTPLSGAGRSLRVSYKVCIRATDVAGAFSHDIVHVDLVAPFPSPPSGVAPLAFLPVPPTSTFTWPCLPGLFGPGLTLTLNATDDSWTSAGFPANCSACLSVNAYSYGGEACGTCGPDSTPKADRSGCVPTLGPSDVAFYHSGSSVEDTAVFSRVGATSLPNASFVNGPWSEAAGALSLTGASAVYEAPSALSPALPTGVSAAYTIAAWARCNASASRTYGTVLSWGEGSAQLVISKETFGVLPVCTGSRVRTMAGKASTPGSLDAFGAAARLHSPAGVAVDGASSTVFIADAATHTIRRVTKGGNVLTVAGVPYAPGALDGARGRNQFNSPVGIAISPLSRDIFVVDRNSSRVRRLSLIDGDAAYVASTVAGSAGSGYFDGPASVARFSMPSGIAFGPDGTAYVADTLNHRVRAISAVDGSVRTIVGDGTPADADGTPGNINLPRGIAYDAFTGTLVVSSATSVRRVSLSGSVSTVAANLGSGLTGVTCLRDGTIFVASSSSNTVWSLAPGTGTATVVAGTGSLGSLDGLAMSAKVADLHLIASDSPGNVIFAETGTSTVRALSPPSCVFPTCDGKWHHYALTYGESGTRTLKAYLDGALQSSVDRAPSSRIHPGTPVRIGDTTGDVTSSPFAGAVSGIRAYSRALSAAEVVLMSGPPAYPNSVAFKTTSGFQVWCSPGFFGTGDMSWTLDFFLSTAWIPVGGPPNCTKCPHGLYSFGGKGCAPCPSGWLLKADQSGCVPPTGPQDVVFAYSGRQDEGVNAFLKANSSRLSYTPDRMGTPNGALVLSGLGGLVTNHMAELPADSEPRTVSLWFKTNTTGSLLVYQACTWCPAVLGLGIYETYYGVGSLLWDWVLPGVTDDRVVADGKWHFIAVTVQSFTFRLYLDGVETASAEDATLMMSPMHGGNQLSIGNGAAPESIGYLGTLADVRIYTRALSASEIASMALPVLPGPFPNAVMSPAAPAAGVTYYAWSCLPGYAGPTMNLSLVPADNSWLSSGGPVNCSICPSGSFSSPGSTTSCTHCSAGRFGSSPGMATSSCSGTCDPGFFCPSGSTSPRQQPCGGVGVFCPPASGAPVPVPAGNYSVPLAVAKDRRSGHASCPPNRLCTGGVLYPPVDLSAVCPGGSVLAAEFSDDVRNTDVGPTLTAAAPGWSLSPDVRFSVIQAQAAAPITCNVTRFAISPSPLSGLSSRLRVGGTPVRSRVRE